MDETRIVEDLEPAGELTPIVAARESAPDRCVCDAIVESRAVLKERDAISGLEWLEGAWDDGGRNRISTCGWVRNSESADKDREQGDWCAHCVPSNDSALKLPALTRQQQRRLNVARNSPREGKPLP